MSDSLKPVGAMAGATLISRVLGMVREICYARFMGDGLVAGLTRWHLRRNCGWGGRWAGLHKVEAIDTICRWR